MYTADMTAAEALQWERSLKGVVIKAKSDGEREQAKADLEDVRARRRELR